MTEPRDATPQDEPAATALDYAALPPVDPDGPGAWPDEAYEVLPDGEYPQEVTRAIYPEVDPDKLILDP